MSDNRMKELRKKRHMSLIEVAELAGKSEASISRYENNPINKLNLDLIENIADALDTSAAYLLGMTDNSDYTSQIKLSEYLENEDLKTILVTNNEMAPEIPEGAHVQIREMNPNEELVPGYFYYVEFDNKKCFRMVINDPDEEVSLMPNNMSERRIGYDKEYAKILGKVISVTVFYLE